MNIQNEKLSFSLFNIGRKLIIKEHNFYRNIFGTYICDFIALHLFKLSNRTHPDWPFFNP